MSKIQMLLNKTKGEHTVFGHVNQKGSSYSFKRALTILEDWALNTLVRFQIAEIIKEALKELHGSSDTLVARGVELEKCRFQFIHAGWDQHGRTPGRCRESQCLRVRLYPVATEDTLLNQRDATYIEIDLSVTKNRITKARIGNHRIASEDSVGNSYPEHYNDWCMSGEAWM